jgi:hypothetical protein
MPRSHRTQLFAGERVPGENRPVEFQRIKDGENIVTETISRLPPADSGLSSRLSD